MRFMKKGLLTVALAAVAIWFAATNITVFVVQPIGSLPEGRTVVLWRQSGNLKFLDSADAVCDRAMHGVSLLCRGVTLAAVVKNNPILVRLPYSETLYLASTNGKSWER
jgi:hypothetical protein